jgi:hypothetical protein
LDVEGAFEKLLPSEEENEGLKVGVEDGVKDVWEDKMTVKGDDDAS